jgi:hypothetical protein
MSHIRGFQKGLELKSTGVIRTYELGFADKSSHRSALLFSLPSLSFRPTLVTEGKMSWTSQHANQDERDLEIVDSVAGSAAACANIS